VRFVRIEVGEEDVLRDVDIYFIEGHGSASAAYENLFHGLSFRVRNSAVCREAIKRMKFSQRAALAAIAIGVWLSVDTTISRK
jgi:hypothetical protein